MFPFVYGFTWDAGNIVFLGIFFGVVAVIVVTVTRALLSARRDLAEQRADTIRWQEDFHDLPADRRACRHEIAGDLAHRTCPNGFDCRACDVHPLIEARRVTRAASADLPLEIAWGLEMSADRLYHRGHTWVRIEPDGTALVGLDDLADRLIGTSEEVLLPVSGTELRVNGTGWTMRKNKGTVRVLAPLDGTVVATGSKEIGWYLRLQPHSGGFDVRHLLKGAEVMAWIQREVDQLQVLLGQRGIGPALADGGEPVKDLPGSNPRADWDAVWGELFLES